MSGASTKARTVAGVHRSARLGGGLVYSSASAMPESWRSLRSVPVLRSRFPWTGMVKIVGFPGWA